MNNAITRACGHVAFLGPWQGALIAALLLVQPRLALAATLALLVAAPVADLLRCDDLPRDLLRCNALLAGAAVGAGSAAWGPTLIAALIAGGAVALLSTALLPLLRRLGLPLFSLPFAIAASGLALVAPQFGPGAMGAAAAAWPLRLLVDLGAIAFLPHALAGLVLLAALSWYSPLMAVMAVLGHGLASLVIAALDLQLADGGFNAPLAAIAVACVLLVPTRRALAIGLLAALAAGLVALAADRLFGNQAVLTLPFNLAALTLLAGLSLRGDSLLRRRFGCSPEAALAEHLQAQARWPAHGRIIAMPVHGRWDVWQGSDSAWTHQGSLRHAVDLLIRDDQGATHGGSGAALEDYHAWRRPVCAPVAGQVVVAVDGVPDNQPGQVDSERNWGNHIVIADARGFWVLLAHLACGSVQVRVGNWVSQGAPIASCGNSGYSPQPHLHLQAQAGPLPGAPTLPLEFGSCLDQAGRFHATIAPQRDQRLRSATADRVLSATLAPILDRSWHLLLTRPGAEPQVCTWTFRMDHLGQTWLSGERGRLRVRQQGGIFCCEVCEGSDPGLRLLARALPSLPLANDDCHWHDVVPAAVADDGWRGRCDTLLAPLLPERACRLAHLSRQGLQVSCTIGHQLYHSVIDPLGGIRRISGDGWELVACAPISDAQTPDQTSDHAA